MFLTYLDDMKSWIFFFLISIGLVDLILWLDEGIAVKFTSALYFNILLIFFFIVFLGWRYRTETKFTAELAELIEEEADDWHVALPEAIYRRDEVTKDMLTQAATHFSRELSNVKKLSVHEGDYIAAWVHEVKTPLTAMKLIIDEHRGNPEFQKLESEWLRLHLLVDQQLSISRLASLETDYVLEKTSLQKLASAEVRELASWCMEKNIAVEFEGDNIEVIADVKWCRFIIRQFLTNAVKYSPIGGMIHISMNKNSTGHAVLTIQDEGSGIQPHELPRIFDKGFTGGTGRIHNAATGLGLYLANTVATKMGITLTVDSQKGEGTLSEIAFPNENDFNKVLT